MFRKGAYDTAFIEKEIAYVPAALSQSETRVVLAAVALHAAQASETNAESGCYALSFPKTDPVRAEVKEGRVSLDGENVELEIFRDEGVILELALATQGTPPRRMAVVPRKKSGYDVALRDRVLRVKCQEET